MKIPLHRLNPDVARYLARVDRTDGDGYPGIFYRRPAPAVTPRYWLPAVAAVACAAVAGYLFLPGALEEYPPPTSSCFEFRPISISVLVAGPTIANCFLWRRLT